MFGYDDIEMDLTWPYEDYLPVYKCPEDCFFEIVTNLFDSKNVNDANLLDDMRWICKEYDVCREIHCDMDGCRNNYIDTNEQFIGLAKREPFADIKSAVEELANRLYVYPKIYRIGDMRGLIAWMLDYYKMDLNLVDDFESEISVA